MVVKVPIRFGPSPRAAITDWGSYSSSACHATPDWKQFTWTLNPRAQLQLAPFGKTVGIPFLLLGAILFVAGVGWFRRRLRAWRLPVIIIATQVVGDLVNAFMGDVLRGAVGFLIAGLCFSTSCVTMFDPAYSGNAPAVH